MDNDSVLERSNDRERPLTLIAKAEVLKDTNYRLQQDVPPSPPWFSVGAPQQPVWVAPVPAGETPQGLEQHASPLPIAPRRIPDAQPAPVCTRMAFTGQLMAQAPHSIQAFWSAMTAFRSFISNTSWGQTMAHIPQPLQASASSRKVTTFFKYLSIPIPPRRILLPSTKRNRALRLRFVTVRQNAFLS